MRRELLGILESLPDDIRIGQAIAGSIKNKYAEFVCTEIFYIEDEILGELIMENFKKWRKK